MLASWIFASSLGVTQVGGSAEEDALRWTAPAECPTREAVLEKITRRLGHPLTEAGVAVDAEVVRDDARGYLLVLRFTAGARHETREVRDASCDALADAAAVLVVAVCEPSTPTIDAEPAPAGGPEPAPPAPEPAPSGSPLPTSPEPAPVNTPGSDVPTRAPRQPGGSVRLLGGGEIGGLPRATAIVGLAGGLLWPRWRLEVQGTFLAPQTAERAATATRVRLLTGAASGCRRSGRGALEVPLCLGLEAGAMRGEELRLPSGRATSVAWLAGLLSPGVAWHVNPRVSVSAAVQLAVTFVHPRFELGAGVDAAPLFTPSRVSGRLLVGIELRLRDRW
jgi:hypothetical protein